MTNDARPNILFIHLDQWRYDCAGFLGNAEVRTPNLDSLARFATVYEQSWCAATWCTSSRYAMLSGLYPHQTGTLSNRSTLPSGTMTWPRRLALEGWSTCAVGKMHCNPTYQDVGYQRMILIEQNGPGQWEDDYHRALDRAGLVDQLDLIDQKEVFGEYKPEWFKAARGAAPSTLPDYWHPSEWVGATALRELATWEGGGHCLHTSFIGPHHPFTPPRMYFERYDPQRLTLLPGWSEKLIGLDQSAAGGHYGNTNFSESELRQVMAAYYASIEHIDVIIGRLLESIAQRGLTERTMVVVTSDHGEYLGFHHLLTKGHFPYQPLTRVPLIIRYPGQLNPQRDARLANTVDLYPTILAALGVDETARGPCSPPSVRLAGTDLRSGMPSPYTFCYAGSHFVVSTAKRKLVLEAGGATLFDLERDPWERHNVVNDLEYADTNAELREVAFRMRFFDASSANHFDADARQVTRQPMLSQVGELAVRAERSMRTWSLEQRHALS